MITVAKSLVVSAMLALKLLHQAGPGNVVVSPQAAENGLRVVQNWSAGKPGQHPQIVEAVALWAAPGVRTNSPAKTIDFGNPVAARAAMNAWIANVTRNQLTTTSMPIDPTMRLVVTSAIAMKAVWSSPFDPRDTKEAPFHVAPKQDVKVRMMQRKGGFVPYAHRDGVQLLELPYTDRDLSMVVILPNATHGLAAIESKLTPQLLDKWIAALSEQEVDVYLPRFRAQTSMNVTATIQERNDRVDSAFTGAYIEVDERGTTAAADFGMSVVTSTSAPPPPPVFRADHSFLYLVRSRATGKIFFLGRVAR